MRSCSRARAACRLKRRWNAHLGKRARKPMLYWLLYERLSTHISPFRVFRFVTARTLFASLTSLFLGVILGPWFIRKLREQLHGFEVFRRRRRIAGFDDVHFQPRQLPGDHELLPAASPRASGLLPIAPRD